MANSSSSWFNESDSVFAANDSLFHPMANVTFVNSSEGQLENERLDPALELSLAVPMGIGMYMLSLLTVVGNAMVLHAIRTERRLQTVSTQDIHITYECVD
jgi:hypothetical protein